MKKKWILPTVLAGALVLAFGGSCVLSSIQTRQARATAARAAEATARRKAVDEAAWRALTPEQHRAEAQAALGKHDLPLARRHANALPGEQSAPILAKAVQIEAAMKAEAKRKAEAEAKARMVASGPSPETGVLTYALESALRKVAHDPESVSDVTVFRPVETRLGPVGCWKADFSYRAKNGFGALRLCRGTVWCKDGAIIKNILE